MFKKNKFKIFSFVIALIALSIISGCGSGSGSSDNGDGTDSIKVGVILPLSGSMAVAGEMMRSGIELATEEYNESGSLPNNAKIELEVFDDRATPSEGVNVTNKLVNDDSISAILGPYNSSVALAVKSIITEAEIPFLSVGTAADEMTESDFDWYFRPHAYNEIQAIKLAEFTSNKLGYKKVALLFENTDYGTGLGPMVVEQLKNLGTEVVIEESFLPDQRDFSSSLAKLESENVDGIVIIALGSEASIIVKQAKDNGIPGEKIVGTGQFDLPDFHELTAGASEDVYFMFWFDENNELAPEAKPFADAFSDKYGESPDSSAAQSYTAAMVLYEAIIASDSTDRESIRDTLEATDLSAPIGPIKFNENHNAETGIFFGQWKGENKEYISLD